jgi:hypothetical protein
LLNPAEGFSPSAGFLLAGRLWFVFFHAKELPFMVRAAEIYREAVRVQLKNTPWEQVFR